MRQSAMCSAWRMSTQLGYRRSRGQMDHEDSGVARGAASRFANIFAAAPAGRGHATLHTTLCDACVHAPGGSSVTPTPRSIMDSQASPR